MQIFLISASMVSKQNLGVLLISGIRIVPMTSVRDQEVANHSTKVK